MAQMTTGMFLILAFPTMKAFRAVQTERISSWKMKERVLELKRYTIANILLMLAALVGSMQSTFSGRLIPLFFGSVFRFLVSLLLFCAVTSCACVLSFPSSCFVLFFIALGYHLFLYLLLTLSFGLYFSFLQILRVSYSGLC
ncbi:hypothetical protein BJ508DRAFT_62548 [Ascobolus immersus RN42]|uniref:Uncharacterized protein n=1 Tax=Ascobolus immersus RN42 TaxID=1160509 RepID=A0A3N4IQ88_ASCIM|nr:hypothetical protein BJ508DRAFT_62548 [Ascobolus immersus RN42]